MTNSELIAQLTRALHVAWHYDMHDGDERTEHAVRAVLLRLADLGSSSEMDLAVAGAVRYLEPGEWDAAFTASLRALAATQQQGER